MVRGRFGLPRPLLNESCVFVIEDFAAGTSELFNLEASASTRFAVSGTRTSQVGDFPSSISVILDDNRISADAWTDFIQDYRERRPDKDTDSVILGVESDIDNRIPRPFVGTSAIEKLMLLEVDFASTPMTDSEIANTAEVLLDEVRYIGSYATAGERSVIFKLNAVGIPNESMMEILDSVMSKGVGMKNIVFTCTITEMESA